MIYLTENGGLKWVSPTTHEGFTVSHGFTTKTVGFFMGDSIESPTLRAVPKEAFYL
jgi:hypothetical protein